eukprot:3308351-Amphidinium_carterae.1
MNIGCSLSGYHVWSSSSAQSKAALHQGKLKALANSRKPVKIDVAVKTAADELSKAKDNTRGNKHDLELRKE